MADRDFETAAERRSNSVVDVARALGYGIVKVMISLIAGNGVGMLVFGLASRDRPEIMEFREPPPELFLSIGAGLLTSAALLVLLFFIPRLWRR